MKINRYFSLFSFVLIGLLASCSFMSSKHAGNQDRSNIAQMDGNMHHGGSNHDMSMDLGPADAEYDLRFIDSMVVHHQGAVNMAREALKKSKRSEIIKLSQDIIKAQNKEIDSMKKWRASWYPKASSQPVAWHSQGNHTMAMSSEQMQTMMMSSPLGNGDDKFDLRFINGMIPHHEGALTMAKDALNKSKHQEIKTLAQSILSSQQKEIDLMKQWRKNWYKV